MKYDVATPYTAAYVLLRDGNKVAMVLRQNCGWMDGFYGLPSGKVEKGEPFTVAAIREAHEEVGVTIRLQDLRCVLVVHRNAPRDDTLWVDAYFEVSNWSGEVINAEPDKHSRVDWLDVNNLPTNVIPPVVAALDQIAAGTVYAEYGWDTTKA